MSRLLEDIETLWDIDGVVSWASPVPFFGHISDARVATVGINPSYREFVDVDGRELIGQRLRLETLDSLALGQWSLASGRDIRRILRSCERYFESNPYRTWFGVLDRVLRIAGASYYQDPGYQRACHIDLVPFATRERWGSLPEKMRETLLSKGRQGITELIGDSTLKVLILNGKSVVSEFERFAEIRLESSPVKEWSLPRQGNEVVGFVYFGSISSIGGIGLDREITILGYNHNLQSSFGVTSQVMRRIGERVGEVLVQSQHD